MREEPCEAVVVPTSALFLALPRKITNHSVSYAFVLVLCFDSLDPINIFTCRSFPLPGGNLPHRPLPWIIHLKLCISGTFFLLSTISARSGLMGHLHQWSLSWSLHGSFTSDNSFATWRILYLVLAEGENEKEIRNIQ